MNTKPSTPSARLMALLERLTALMVVALMLLAAAAWSGSLLGRPFGGQSAAPQAAAPVPVPDATTLQALGLEGAQLAATDSAAWRVTDAQGRELGLVVSSAPYAAQVQGFAGPTPLYIYVAANGRIKAIAVGPNGETPDFLRRAREGLLPQWQGLSLADGAALQIDAVSGATLSSRALSENVRLALQARLAPPTTSTPAPAIGWGRTAAVAAVLLLSAGLALRGHTDRRARLAVLVLNVAVLGFWCGQFLSLSLLRGWAAHGFAPVLSLPTLLMLALAVVMPFVGRKHFYCTWVCPLGSLQRLVWLAPVPKWHVGPATWRVLRRVRLGVLMALMVLLWTGLGASALDYEPFTAFLVASAAPAVLVLAGIIVVLSLFVPSPWCAALCPMGALLDLADEPR